MILRMSVLIKRENQTVNGTPGTFKHANPYTNTHLLARVMVAMIMNMGVRGRLWTLV